MPEEETTLILYCIADALSSALTAESRSDRYDDVLWLTQGRRNVSRKGSLQFFCEMLGMNFEKVQSKLIDVLIDTNKYRFNAKYLLNNKGVN